MDFEVKERETKISPGHIYLNCHLNFDVKMNFTQKDRFVDNGSITLITSASAYAELVSRETLSVLFTYTALNGLDIMSSDIQNYYLQAPIY